MLRAVSADSHVLEPLDLWTQRIEASYQERAPFSQVAADGTHLFGFEGRPASPIKPFGTPYAMWNDQEEEVRTGGWDPIARMTDMDRDGILAEVLYPSLAMGMYGIEDGGLQAACFRAYNDWLAEYCSTNPIRLHGVGLIPSTDLEVATNEMRRVRQLGLGGAAVWGNPPEGYSFNSDRYDRLWAEAQDLEMPISLHCYTGKASNWGNFLAGYTVVTQLIQQSIAQLIFANVFERFPNLRVISVENDIGWVPYFMQRMDYGYQRKGPRHTEPFKSGLNPSEIFSRNVRCTFMSDAAGIASLDLIGSEVLMWSTDYPHDDSSWPVSQQVAEEQFSTLAVEDRDRIVFSNAVDLYRMDLDA